VADKTGFREANHGTLFLDEVDSTSQQLQTKNCSGFYKIAKFDAWATPTNLGQLRTIAASNEQLKLKSKTVVFAKISITGWRSFRSKFHRCENVWRSSAFSELLPAKYAALNRDRTKEIDVRAMESPIRYGWPGNVRELENAVERACALSEVSHQSSGSAAAGPAGSHQRRRVLGSRMQIGQHLDDFVRNQERKYIEMT